MDTQQLPRFTSRGGAAVEVVPHTLRHVYLDLDRNELVDNLIGHAWQCSGCDASGTDTPWTAESIRFPRSLDVATAGAQTHADTCQAEAQR
ncbi:hypothetical protein ACFVH6_21670 [Spirillospora sp. NPDC127200]